MGAPFSTDVAHQCLCNFNAVNHTNHRASPRPQTTIENRKTRPHKASLMGFKPIFRQPPTLPKRTSAAASTPVRGAFFEKRLAALAQKNFPISEEFVVRGSHLLG